MASDFPAGSGRSWPESRAVEAGHHEDLLAAGGRYAELYALQAAAYT